MYKEDDLENLNPILRKIVEPDLSKDWTCLGCDREYHYLERVSISTHTCGGCGYALLRPSREVTDYKEDLEEINRIDRLIEGGQIEKETG